MDRIRPLLSRHSPSFFGKWFWITAIVVMAIVLLLAVVGISRFTALFDLYWGRANIERLFYEDLGLSRSWSAFIAVVASPFYALAWVPLTAWVLIGRFEKRQLAVAFICWVFVY